MISIAHPKTLNAEILNRTVEGDFILILSTAEF